MKISGSKKYPPQQIQILSPVVELHQIPLILYERSMAVITSTLSPSKPKQLRPFDSRRDLMEVADLIEFCFSSNLDPDGRRYLRQMRSAARKQGVSRWSSLATGQSVLPMAGFVWEESGKVVGNLSLVPFFSQSQRIDLIANVGVYPEFRNRGIAQALTSAALEKSRLQRVSAVWLQVRHNNQAATSLYIKMGFKPRARRTTWVADPSSLQGEPLPGLQVTFRRAPHWSRQCAWLNHNYPQELRWHLPLKTTAMKPGFWGMLYRFFNEVNVRHWAVESQSGLLGVLSWQEARGYADHLWLAALPQNEDQALRAVLPFIRRERRLSRPLSLDYPENRAVEAFTRTGFTPKSTLIWMNVSHNRPMFD